MTQRQQWCIKEHRASEQRTINHEEEKIKIFIAYEDQSVITSIEYNYWISEGHRSFKFKPNTARVSYPISS
jgi:hypothetical protein